MVLEVFLYTFLEDFEGVAMLTESVFSFSGEGFR